MIFYIALQNKDTNNKKIFQMKTTKNLSKMAISDQYKALTKAQRCMFIGACVLELEVGPLALTTKISRDKFKGYEKRFAEDILEKLKNGTVVRAHYVEAD